MGMENVNVLSERALGVMETPELAVDPDAAEFEPTEDQTTVLPAFDASLNMDPVDELDMQLRKASFFMQASLEKQGKLTQRLDAYLTGLLDVLIDSGVISPEQLGEVVNRNRQLQAEEQAAQLSDNGGLNAWPLVLVRDEQPDEPTE